MSDQNVENVVRDFVGALFKPDLDKVLSMCAEDVEWVTPQGTFQRKDGVKRYWTWVTATNSDLTYSDSGIRVMVQGDKAVYEHVIGGKFKGMKWQIPVMCAYEFKDGKVQHLRTVYDRLALAKQAAKGCFAKRIVNSVVKQTEQGLR